MFTTKYFILKIWLCKMGCFLSFYFLTYLCPKVCFLIRCQPHKEYKCESGLVWTEFRQTTSSSGLYLFLFLSRSSLTCPHPFEKQEWPFYYSISLSIFLRKSATCCSLKHAEICKTGYYIPKYCSLCFFFFASIYVFCMFPLFLNYS